MKFYQSDLSFFRKTALDEPLYKFSAGRSMVEMLGVLAIIGVLSVGAISGYSKAMMKYKLNKQTEQIGSILDYVTINSDKFTHDFSMDFSTLLQKLGAIPMEMIKDKSSAHIYDTFGNRIYPYLQDDGDGYSIYYALQISIGKYSHEVCINLFQMAKLRSANLWQTLFVKDTNDASNIQTNRVYGDDYCSSQLNCLKDLTLPKMEDLCSVCDESKSYCYFYILWGRIDS